MAADFKPYPVDSLTDPEGTRERIRRIAEEYQQSNDEFPFIFVIGHANRVDDPKAMDKSESQRRHRNWNYGGKRAATIASALCGFLGENERDRVVILSSGEQDLRSPSQPYSSDNAWVEIVFGKEWKLPSAQMAGATE